MKLKKYYKLALVFLVFLFLMLSVFVLSQNYFNDFQKSDQTLEQALKNLVTQKKPFIEINLTELYSSNIQFQVLYPMFNKVSLKNAKNSFSCQDKDNNKIKASYNKYNQYSNLLTYKAVDSTGNEISKRQLLSNQQIYGEKLPEDFLQRSPMIDDYGNSYANLLANGNIKPFNTKEWVEAHLSYFRTTELVKIFEKFKIEEPHYKVLSNLSESEVVLLVQSMPAVITSDYLFIKNQALLGFSPLSYSVYKLNEIQNYLRTQKYEMSIKNNNSTCLATLGNVCWTYSSSHLFSYLNKNMYLIGGLLLFIFIILSVYFMSYFLQKQKNYQNHQMALQILSHEFRTPVASLLLLIDQMRHTSNSNNLETQDLVVRMSTDVFKLQRIIETSKVYMQAENQKINFQFEYVESINSLFSDLVENHNTQTEIILLNTDRLVKIDLFWFSFVIKSLLNNAYMHGKAPVRATLLLTKNNSLVIQIQDSGVCQFKSLNQMTESFVKSHTSAGMGLGLNIIQHVAQSMNAHLTYSYQPTTFSIEFKI